MSNQKTLKQLLQDFGYHEPYVEQQVILAVEEWLTQKRQEIIDKLEDNRINNNLVFGDYFRIKAKKDLFDELLEELNL